MGGVGWLLARGWRGLLDVGGELQGCMCTGRGGCCCWGGAGAGVGWGWRLLLLQLLLHGGWGGAVGAGGWTAPSRKGVVAWGLHLLQLLQVELHLHGGEGGQVALHPPAAALGGLSHGAAERGGWARAGDTAGDGKPLGGRAAARLLGP